MIALDDILKGVKALGTYGPAPDAVKGLHFDSRKVSPGGMFVATKGVHFDGHCFMDPAIQQGVTVIVCETLPVKTDPHVHYIQVENSAQTLGILASNYHGNPSSKLSLVGVTGTNGKTTTATLLYRLFRALGHKTGLLSTIQHQVNDTVIPSMHTTPDPIILNELLQRMVSEGCRYCFMEVSSHGIRQDRIAGVRFTGAVFTNITHDHLDYHLNFTEYLQSKKKFFDGLPSSAFALTNADDRNGRTMVQNTSARIYTYALKHLADFRCKIIENRLEGLQLEIGGHRTWFRLAGEFNAYNILAIYSVAVILDQDPDAVLTHLSDAVPVRGRFEAITSQDQVMAIVDYAHTPDALKNVLKTLQLSRLENQALITVIGAGGDRDASKRPKMGKIAATYSDRVIFTSDNPRSEDPEEIIRQMMAGVPVSDRSRAITIVNRKEALKAASMLAKPGDVILVAGKGHETYQEIQGVKYPFDDKKIMEEIFLQRTPNPN